ncbi:MAG: hypothetical protein HQK96_13435 [Nitrospirae bacterium]|nr:hypothetical protein [Nitrospirota bacterium]
MRKGQKQRIPITVYMEKDMIEEFNVSGYAMTISDFINIMFPYFMYLTECNYDKSIDNESAIENKMRKKQKKRVPITVYIEQKIYKDYNKSGFVVAISEYINVLFPCFMCVAEEAYSKSIGKESFVKDKNCEYRCNISNSSAV